MTIRNRLRLVGVGLIAFSVYIGLEIDFRHWAGWVFLILLPAVLVGVLVSTREKPPKESDETR